MAKGNYSVFLVCGRDRTTNNFLISIFSAMGIQTITWETALSAARERNALATTLDVVRKGFSLADSVVVLFTPDEYVSCKKKFRETGDKPLERQSRPNVMLEAGMAIALADHFKKNVVFVMSNTRKISDIDGIHYIPFDENIVARLHNEFSRYVRSDLYKLESTSAGTQLPKFNTDNIFFEKPQDTEAPLIAYMQRGNSGYYIEKIKSADHIDLIGASHHSILQDMIRNSHNYERKKIRILLPGRDEITKNFDQLEKEYGRSLAERIAKNCENIATLKAQGCLNDLGIRFYQLYNSSTIYIIDHMMWVTPYTHLAGDCSPSYYIPKDECPEIFRHYQEYFNYVWENSKLCREAI